MHGGRGAASAQVRNEELLFPEIVLLHYFFSRQVIIVLTQLEGSGGFSIAHRLTHRLSHSAGLHDWAEGGDSSGGGSGEDSSHVPKLESTLDGLHAARPL